MEDHTRDNVIEGLNRSRQVNGFDDPRPGASDSCLGRDWKEGARSKLRAEHPDELNQKVGDLSVFFQTEWFKTPEGQEFTRRGAVLG